MSRFERKARILRKKNGKSIVQYESVQRIYCTSCADNEWASVIGSEWRVWWPTRRFRSRPIRSLSAPRLSALARRINTKAVFSNARETWADKTNGQTDTRCHVVKDTTGGTMTLTLTWYMREEWREKEEVLEYSGCDLWCFRFLNLAERPIFQLHPLSSDQPNWDYKLSERAMANLAILEDDALRKIMLMYHRWWSLYPKILEHFESSVFHRYSDIFRVLCATQRSLIKRLGNFSKPSRSLLRR